MKKFRKLIPALALLLVSAVLMSTASYAWFSMNTKVTVTGMKVTTKVNNNLLISETATGTTAAMAESDFKTSYIGEVKALLEPTSTTDGKNYLYTSTKNVQGTGAVLTPSYVAYNPADTAAFNSNAGTTGAVGYVDYAFGLKASNTDASPAFVNMTAAQLVYGNSQTDPSIEHAFRIAVFVEDIGTTLAATSGDVGTLKTILKPTGGDYFTSGSAVNSSGVVGTVSNLGTAANIATVAANTTHYYKVVVRLWLEGEDKTCNNNVFANLTDEWALNLTIELQNTTGGVTAIAESNGAKVDLSTDSASATTVVVDNITYYQLTSHTTYYSSTASFTNASRVFQIVDGHPIDVTNTVKLPA